MIRTKMIFFAGIIAALTLFNGCFASGGTGSDENIHINNGENIETDLDDINVTIDGLSPIRIDTGFEQSNTVSIRTQAQHGTAEAILVGGEFWQLRYTPKDCFVGIDSFIYQTADKHFGRVNIISNEADLSGETDRTVTIRSDQYLLAEKLSDATSLSIKTAVAHGRFDYYATTSGESLFNYFPDKNFNGTDFFDYNITQTVGMCHYGKTVRVSIVVEPVPSAKVAVFFPDSNGTCRVGITDGDTNLTISNDTMLIPYDTCTLNDAYNLYRVNDDFFYANYTTLHRIRQDATVVDVNPQQRNDYKTSSLILSKIDLNHPTIYHDLYRYGGGMVDAGEKFIYSADTPLLSGQNDTLQIAFGTIPWITSGGQNDVTALNDIVGDTVDTDYSITPVVGMDEMLYFLGYDSTNGSGVTLERSDQSRSSDDLSAKVCYLDQFDSNLTETDLWFLRSDIVTVLNKTLLFTYTTYESGRKAMLYLSDGDGDVRDGTYNPLYHTRLISSGEYEYLNLEKAENSQRVFYMGKNISSDKIDIGYIKEEGLVVTGYNYLYPNNFTNILKCTKTTVTGRCLYGHGVLDKEFSLKPLVTLSNNSEFKTSYVVADNGHFYYKDGEYHLYGYDGDTTKEIDVGISNQTVIDTIHKIGNYIYVLERSINDSAPSRLWVVDPATDTPQLVENAYVSGGTTHRFIKIFENALDSGSTIAYTVFTTDENETATSDFNLTSYDAKNHIKRAVANESNFVLN